MPTLPSSSGRQQPLRFAGFALLLTTVPLSSSGPWAALWTAPCILLASVLITWGAESAQFFVAQGFALAILAWMQTLPEFAVEAVLAWRQQSELLLANLTGALRLLTGLAWPMIYATAAFVHRKRKRRPLGKIRLIPHQSVEVIGLILPLAYALVIWWKKSLGVLDAGIMVLLYAAYLFLLMKLPAEDHEGIDDLEAVPKRIVLAPRSWRMLAIAACFLVGGTMIYLVAEPFLGSLVAVAGALGIPTFVIVQWLAPIISEFPELASTFYFARQEEKAPMALMNIASSNINQWTLLIAMLPVVFSLSKGQISSIDLDTEQQVELLLTIGQSFAGLVFLMNMEFAWWEALIMFLLFICQFALPPVFGEASKVWITAVFFGWGWIELVFSLVRDRELRAFSSFAVTWKAHVVS